MSRAALAGFVACLLLTAALPARAAAPTITFETATADAPEEEARKATPREEEHVTRIWAVKARAVAEGEGDGAFVRSMSIRVLAIAEERGSSYAGGQPIGEQAYPCPGPETPAEEITPAVSIETVWNSEASVNGVYEIVALARSCAAEDEPGSASRVPVYVDNPPPPVTKVDAVESDGVVRLFWSWSGVPDGDGFRILRGRADGKEFRAVGTARALNYDDRPPEGRYRYQIVALRKASRGDVPIAAQPSPMTSVVLVRASAATVAQQEPPSPSTLPVPPPVDTSPAESEAPPVLALPVDEGTYDPELPIDPGEITVAIPGPFEEGVGDPNAQAPAQDIELRRKLSRREALGKNVSLIGAGVILLVSSVHVGSLLRRTSGVVSLEMPSRRRRWHRFRPW